MFYYHFFAASLQGGRSPSAASFIIPITRAGGIRGAEQFVISCRDVQSVIILGSFPAELEIRTAKEVFTGTFQKPADMNAAAAALRAVFGKRFLEQRFG